MANSPHILLHGRRVEALSPNRLAQRCLVTSKTVHRWLENGRIRPAREGSQGETTYYFQDDVEQLRASNLSGIRMKLSAGAVTTDERAALAVAGLEDLQTGLKQLQEMFGRMAAADEKRKRAAAGTK